MYGASSVTYDALTRRPGSYLKFVRGVTAASEAGLNVRLNIIVTRCSQHERKLMVSFAESRGLPYFVYDRLSPTIYGDSTPLAIQATDRRSSAQAFTGCDAGMTFFHIDQRGRASICKISRAPSVDLVEGGVAVLESLRGFAKSSLDDRDVPSDLKGAVCAPQARLLSVGKMV